MKAGTIKKNELWIRCVFCGDSTRDPHKAHLRIHLETGLYFCHRCNERGKVTTSFLMKLNLRSDIPIVDFSPSEGVPTLYKGPYNQRFSLLPRYNTGSADAFKIYWLGTPEAIGLYLRGDQKKILGFSGMAWPQNPTPFISSPENPLRLVEGPYDVVRPQDVCMFGLFNPKLILHQLKHHYFILSPDGDVWTDPRRKRAFFSSLTQIIKNNMNLMGVEYNLINRDPDEKISSDLIPVSFLKERIKINGRQNYLLS